MHGDAKEVSLVVHQSSRGRSLATPITFGPWALWLGGRARVPGEEHLLSCCGWIIREGSGGRVSPTGAIRVGRIALCNTISPYTHIYLYGPTQPHCIAALPLR